MKGKAASIPYPHPGETLLDVMDPLKLSVTEVAKALGVSRASISGIVAGRRRINAEMALLLEAVFGTSAQFWINLQMGYDLDKARSNKKLAASLTRIPKLLC